MVQGSKFKYSGVEPQKSNVESSMVEVEPWQSSVHSEKKSVLTFLGYYIYYKEAALLWLQTGEISPVFVMYVNANTSDGGYFC